MKDARLDVHKLYDDSFQTEIIKDSIYCVLLRSFEFQIKHMQV